MSPTIHSVRYWLSYVVSSVSKCSGLGAHSTWNRKSWSTEPSHNSKPATQGHVLLNYIALQSLKISKCRFRSQPHHLCSIIRTLSGFKELSVLFDVKWARIWERTKGWLLNNVSLALWWYAWIFNVIWWSPRVSLVPTTLVSGHSMAAWQQVQLAQQTSTQRTQFLKAPFKCFPWISSSRHSVPYWLSNVVSSVSKCSGLGAKAPKAALSEARSLPTTASRPHRDTFCRITSLHKVSGSTSAVPGAYQVICAQIVRTLSAFKGLWVLFDVNWARIWERAQGWLLNNFALAFSWYAWIFNVTWWSPRVSLVPTTLEYFMNWTAPEARRPDFETRRPHRTHEL